MAKASNKDGGALSGLSRQTGDCLVPSGKRRGMGRAPKPHQRGLRPLSTLPPDWRLPSSVGEAEGTRGCAPKPPTKEGCALSRLSRQTGDCLLRKMAFGLRCGSGAYFQENDRCLDPVPTCRGGFLTRPFQGVGWAQFRGSGRLRTCPYQECGVESEKDETVTITS